MAGELEPDNLSGPFQPLPFYDSMSLWNNQYINKRINKQWNASEVVRMVQENWTVN